MKYIAIAFVSFSLMVSSCKEEQRKVTADMINFAETASANTEDQDFPELTFDNDTLNFGQIAVGEKITHAFSFKNTGEEPLTILQVSPSCGCTTLKDWPKDPIMPGEGGKITVEFNSANFSGPIYKTVSVSANTIPRDWTLTLMGEVIGKEKLETGEKSTIEMKRVR